MNKCIIFKNFLGNSPDWYKVVIIIFLIINPICFLFNNFIAGWLLIVEFIFILSMSLKCYPLQPGGLISLESVILGMTSVKHVSLEIFNNIDVILLLIFMISSIHFMKELLLLVFTKLLLFFKSKVILSIVFCFVSALLSAFLDALTVIAVIISVALSFYHIYDDVYLTNKLVLKNKSVNYINSEKIKLLDKFRSFLRSLMMHSGIGTALGGVMTMVGEPQNLIIAKYVGWGFNDFFLHMLPITLPVLFSGLIVCYFVERFRLFGYGEKLPKEVCDILKENFNNKKYCKSQKLKLIVQGIACVWLVIALAFHLAEAGIIGLSVIILVTSFCGITDEKYIGNSFRESLPFVSLLMVFFSIVAVISDQKLFLPLIKLILNSSKSSQLFLFYLCNGLFSSISDNVFIGTIYIREALNALKNGVISFKQFEYIAVAINTGTNLPSVATPNGQAAFLFLLTSSLAPIIRLSYMKMILMAMPYTIVITFVGFLGISLWLIPVTNLLM